jgi:hypothetical protein
MTRTIARWIEMARQNAAASVLAIPLGVRTPETLRSGSGIKSKIGWQSNQASETPMGHCTV